MFGDTRKLLIPLIASCLLAIGPAAAHADTASQNPEFGPTLGDGYVYWVTSSRKHGDGPYKTRTVFQRRLSDGRTRVVFRIHRSLASGLYARGDKVAFGFTQISRDPTATQTGRLSDVVYAMSAEDVAPKQIIVSRTTVSPFLKTCGQENVLHDVTPAGQTLVKLNEHPCTKGVKPTTSTKLFSLDGSAPVPIAGFRFALFGIIQSNRLAVVTENGVTLQDLATGQNLIFPSRVEPYWVTVSEDGHFATAAETGYSWRRGKARTEINIFSPGSTQPTARIREWLDGDPVILFCAGGLAELTIPGKGPMVIRLRSFDGTVLKSLSGPDSGESKEYSFDSVCVGNHLTIASTRKPGPPAISSYDF
jgi:hypothetical protein